MDEQWLHTCRAIISANINSETATPEQLAPTTSSAAMKVSSGNKLPCLLYMTDEQYLEALQNYSSNQRLRIDKIYSHNRSHIMNTKADQLLLFVTGGAGVGKSFLIRTIKDMLIRMHNLVATTGIAAYNRNCCLQHGWYHSIFSFLFTSWTPQNSQLCPLESQNNGSNSEQSSQTFDM